MSPGTDNAEPSPRITALCCCILACNLLLALAPFCASGSCLAQEVGLPRQIFTAHHYEVRLRWNRPDDSRDPIVGYRVYRATANRSAPYKLLNRTGLVTMPNWIDTTVRRGVTYRYIVTSVDRKGAESFPSNSIQLTIP